MTILAIDLGTSAVKLMRVDNDLHVLAVDRIPVSGLNVEMWLDVIRENLLAHGDRADIHRIAITGQMHGLITLEDAGYGEGMSWTEQRGTTLIPTLNEEFGPDVAMRTGGPFASGFQAVSLAWLRTAQPDHWQRIRKVMLPKDALIHALTGEHVTEPSDAAGTGMFDVTKSDWARDVVNAIGIPHDWLPRIVPSGTDVGPVLPRIAHQFGIHPDTTVVIAGGDAPVGAIGAGVTRSGQALVMLSSGAQIILPSGKYEPDPAGRWYTWPAALPPGNTGAPYLRVGTLLNAGIATSWLGDVLAESATIASDPTNLIAVPHLIGERTPLRDPDARGAMLGISPETTLSELSRAMLEGVAFALRHALDVMCESIPRPEVIRLGGGGAQSDAWQAIITNVLGIPTERVFKAELSVYGAARLAANSATPTTGPCGRFPSRPEELPTSGTSTVRPDPKLVAHYDMRHAIYRDALDAIAPISHRLAALEHPS